MSIFKMFFVVIVAYIGWGWSMTAATDMPM